MEFIKFDRVLSVSSEIPNHGASVLLQSEIVTKNSWLCQKGSEKGSVILKLERAGVLSSIHIGNSHSAFVEVLVGRASEGVDSFQTLIPTSTFMTPNESKQSENPNKVRFFTKDDFESSLKGQQWDLIKIVCSQPFNKQVSFGLCFVRVQAQAIKLKLALLPAEEEDTIEIGSFFRKKKQESPQKNTTVSEQIRAEGIPDSVAKHTPLSVGKIANQMRGESKLGKRKDSMESIDNRKNRDFGLEENCEPGNKRKKEERSKDIPSTSSSSSSTTLKTTKPKTDLLVQKVQSSKSANRKPFEKLMNGVVFVLSGFQNPLRSEIRSKVLEMGGKYRQDWDDDCTHLVAAFLNTPKCREVHGKGKIVSEKWVEKCYADRKRHPWRRFALDSREQQQVESEEEILYNISPDDDVGESNEFRPVTPASQDFFQKASFYLDKDIKDSNVLERYIISFNGVLSPKLNETVSYFITRKTGQSLETLKKAYNFEHAVSPTWLLAINHSQKFLPFDNYLID